MSAPNFNCSHNSRHMAVFCISEDFEAYKKDSKENDPDWYEENEDYLENSPWAQSDWYDEEKRYYLDWLEEKLKESGLNARNFADAGKVCDGDEVCTVGTSFRFAGIDFDLVVSIDFEAGYYDGFKLDWNIKEICGIDTDSLKWIDAEDLTDALTGTWTGWGSYREYNSPGLAKMLAPKLRKRIERELAALTGKIDDCLEAIAPHCWEGMTLGNGEGIYFEQKEAA